MNSNDCRLPGGITPKSTLMSALLIAIGGLVAACGGGSGTEPPPQPAAQCIPSDPATAAECGTLIIGLTDADGDFLSYTVDVVSLELEKQNGASIQVLPNRTRIDFAQYVHLTEFVSAATVPPGNYVAGTITLDYSGAEVFVEAGGVAKEAVVVDAEGVPLQQAELHIRLSDRDHLPIVRGVTALLTLDFDLDASHFVDIQPTPAIAQSEPFIVAEVSPVDSKEIRVRGRLVDTDIDEMYYTVALRPFHDGAGDFGRVRVNVADDTDFEINEQAFVGADGLRALEVAGEGTLTVARGVLDVSERSFTADFVLAGSSVPGNGRDAVKGNVISRTGDEFVVRGGTVVLSDAGHTFFRDDVTVTVGPETIVYRSFRGDRPMGMPVRLLDTGAISIGQAVTVRGDVVVNDDNGTHIDATRGVVTMHLTHLSGIVNTALPGQVDIELHAIDRRRAAVFDFTGTGVDRNSDADPANYEVASGPIMLDAEAVGRPVVVVGFPAEFGAAPPDFLGRTFIDFSDVRSALGVGWGPDATSAPFLAIDETGMLLNNRNPDVDERHYIKQGPVLIDLTSLDSDTLIVPPESGRTLFAIRTSDNLQLFGSFTDFREMLSEHLAAGAARSMYARGHYGADVNVFTAYRIYVTIIEP